MKKYLLCLLLIFSSLAHAETLKGTAEIIDADSLSIDNREIRLHGIDAPEYRQACILPDDKKFYPGREAKKWLQSLIGNKNISCDIIHTDRYGREISTCYVNDKNINEALVRQGFAFANRFYSERYIPAEEEAAFERLGIWRGKCESPYEYRRKNRISGTAEIKDADTLIIKKQEVRLHGIDAPELGQTCILPNGKEFYPGKEGVTWLKSFIANKSVSCNVFSTDKYGRKISICSVDGKNINQELVRQGFAFAHRQYSDRYIADEEQSASEGIGLWRGKCESPDEYRSKKEQLSGHAKIIDGDSLIISGQEIRLYGVDALAPDRACILPDGKEFYPGQEVSAWLESLIANRKVSCNVFRTDKYGRKISICSVDDKSINEELVHQGFAFAHRFYTDRYAVEEEEAKSAKAGMWGGDCGTTYEEQRIYEYKRRN